MVKSTINNAYDGWTVYKCDKCGCDGFYYLAVRNRDDHIIQTDFGSVDDSIVGIEECEASEVHNE